MEGHSYMHALSQACCIFLGSRHPTQTVGSCVGCLGKQEVLNQTFAKAKVINGPKYRVRTRMATNPFSSPLPKRCYIKLLQQTLLKVSHD